MKKLLLLLLLLPNLVMAEYLINFTDETLDLFLVCKGDGYSYDNTFKKTPISINETLYIKADKNGGNRLTYFGNDLECLTTTTEISCAAEYFNSKVYKQKLKENIHFLRAGSKVMINRITGEAKISLIFNRSSLKSDVICEKKSKKF